MFLFDTWMGNSIISLCGQWAGFLFIESVMKLGFDVRKQFPDLRNGR